MKEGHPADGCQIAEVVLCKQVPYAVVEFGRKPCGHPITMTLCLHHWNRILDETKRLYNLRCNTCKKIYPVFPTITNWWFV